jgi:gallate decarboxylase subunit D
VLSEEREMNTHVVTAAAGAGRHRVEGTAVVTAAGVVLCLAGGERGHIGAVGLGVPRPSQRDPARRSATSSVLTLTGHRDDELAKPLAEWAAARLGQVAVVTVGVHVEGATPEEIALLSANTREAAESLLAGIESAERSSTGKTLHQGDTP